MSTLSAGLGRAEVEQRGARGWASVAFLLGVAVSVAANVAHTYYIPGTGRPPIGAQLAAAFYPLALLLVVEILARVPWPSTWAWSAARYGGASVVAAVAAVVSYRHMAALLTAYGEDALTARIGPLAVDGLMVVASLALLAIGRERATGPLPRDVMRDEMGPAEPLPDGYAMWAEIEPEPVATALPEVPDDEPVSSDVKGAIASNDHDLAPVLATARDRFAETLATGGLPSVRALRRTLHIGHPRAVRVRAALEAESTLATA